MAVAVNTSNIPTVSPVDALWSLIQHQSKTVRRTLARRLDESIRAENEPKIKMSEGEFYAKIDHSLESAKTGNVFTMGEDETGEDFINRMLS